MLQPMFCSNNNVYLILYMWLKQCRLENHHEIQEVGVVLSPIFPLNLIYFGKNSRHACKVDFLSRDLLFLFFSFS